MVRNAYMLRNEIMSQYDDIDVQVEVTAGVCDEGPFCATFFRKYHPTAVFHAAAHNARSPYGDIARVKRFRTTCLAR